jgi:hypothetical protein
VILDTKGNIFGGFTPVEWESREWNNKSGEEDNRWKADDSLKSFLFTLKNPHNIAARRLPLKDERKHEAIACDLKWGPLFGDDVNIYNGSNANTNSNTWRFSSTYTNDTELEGSLILAGSMYFRVVEIELFEITD